MAVCTVVRIECTVYYSTVACDFSSVVLFFIEEEFMYYIFIGLSYPKATQTRLANSETLPHWNVIQVSGEFFTKINPIYYWAY